MKKLIILILLSCNTAVVEKSRPTGTTININDDGSSTVFTRYDSSATVVNLTKDGELLDSVWMRADPNISNDSIIKAYYLKLHANKVQ